MLSMGSLIESHSHRKKISELEDVSRNYPNQKTKSKREKVENFPILWQTTYPDTKIFQE